MDPGGGVTPRSDGLDVAQYALNHLENHHLMAVDSDDDVPNPDPNVLAACAIAGALLSIAQSLERLARKAEEDGDDGYD